MQFDLDDAPVAGKVLGVGVSGYFQLEMGKIVYSLGQPVPH